MQNLIDFISFVDPNVRFVVVGTVSIAIGASLVGTFTFLRKQSLVGDAVAHSILPGICFAFIISGTKNTFYLIIGAFISGWFSVILMDWVTKKTKLKSDTGLAFVLTFFFAIGAMLLSYIQNSGNASQSGLDQYLFGKAAAIGSEDIFVFVGISLFLIISIILFFKTFKIISFNSDFAKSIGINVRLYETILHSLTVLAIASGIQAVGVVLMAALLITPATIARQWSNKLKLMIILAVTFAFISGFFGAYISYTAPSMPTGPWIVVVLSTLAIISVFVAPQKGIISRIYIQSRNKNKIHRENLLKTIYLCFEDNKISRIKTNQILERRNFSTKRLEKELKKLKVDGLILMKKSQISFTSEGLSEAKKIVKLHRLWEMYLTQRMNFSIDHIHSTAETMEHIITPEIEKIIEKELNFPKKDPHNKTIPY